MFTTRSKNAKLTSMIRTPKQRKNLKGVEIAERKKAEKPLTM